MLLLHAVLWYENYSTDHNRLGNYGGTSVPVHFHLKQANTFASKRSHLRQQVARTAAGACIADGHGP